MVNQDGKFKTQNMFEAAAIMLFAKLTAVEKEGKIFFFVFDDEATQYSNEYWLGNLQGNLKEYANNIKSCKDMIFSGPQSNSRRK